MIDQSLRRLMAGPLLFILLAGSSSAFGHHRDFYEPFLGAVEKDRDLSKVRCFFTNEAWQGRCGWVSGAKLQRVLSEGEKVFAAEYNGYRYSAGEYKGYRYPDWKSGPSHCAIHVEVAHKDGLKTSYWVLAEGTLQREPKYRWNWRVIGIVTDEDFAWRQWLAREQPFRE